MAINLVQHRGEPSVWDRANAGGTWDAERWLLGAMAGALFAAGFRQRTPAGFLIVLGGAALAWWAAAGADERQHRRGQLQSAWRERRHGRVPDLVREASEESFPASDAPSWTPSTGNLGPTPSKRAH